ncbi:MAG TPA: hypothetical protein VHW47_00560 [Acidimicrobiales bacterium]|nr:hypothetical protein [Acidimicrobiales bacterium]
MKRPFWLATGVVLGVSGTLWAEQRVRRGVEQAVARLAPNAVANEAVESVRQLGDRVRGAVVAGRQERDRREAELWEELESRHPQPLRPGTAGAAVGTPTRGRHVKQRR